jgi:hypothetical protein
MGRGSSEAGGDSGIVSQSLPNGRLFWLLFCWLELNLSDKVVA